MPPTQLQSSIGSSLPVRQVANATRQTSEAPPTSDRSPTSPVLRANPFPEVTDLICRLPLPTLFYRLEAEHLRNLMRIRVRSGGKITSVASLFKDPSVRTGRHRNRGVLQARRPYLRLNRFQGVRPSSRKENSTLGTERRSQATLRCRASRPRGPTISHARSGNINPVPFRHRPLHNVHAAIPRALASGLGPTEPHATAVHVEPFPPSVLKVLT